MAINLDLNFPSPEFDLDYVAFPEKTVDTTTITGLTGANKFVGGVLAENDKIYFIPRFATYVIILDTKTHEIDITTISGLPATDKWVGGVLADNGKIYCVPLNIDFVLIIDTVTNTIDTTSITGLAGTNKWAGAVLAPNKKIYLIPANSTVVGIIDTTNDTIDTTSITGLTGTDKWNGGTLADNGKIYCAPGTNVIGRSVLIIDPETNTADTTTISNIPGIFVWVGSCLSVNRKVYAMTHRAGWPIAIIDIDANTLDQSTIVLPGPVVGFNGGIATAVDGNIYLCPGTIDYLGFIDPATDVLDSTTITGLAGFVKWIGLVKGRNGLLYGVPSCSTSVLIATLGVPVLPNRWVTSAYDNKF